MPSTELSAAVDGLINTSRVRLYREDTKRYEWKTVPAIWTQLMSSAQWGSREAGSARFSSRPVISTGVVSLVADIRDSAAEAAAELKRTIWTYHISSCACDPYATPRRPCELRHWRTHNTPKELRAIAADLQDAEQIGWWTEKLTRWAAEAREALKLDPPNSRSARGATCPACGESIAYIKQAPKEYVRTPALAIVWKRPEGDDYHADTDWRVGAVECRSCQMAWARGETLHILIDQMLEANRTQETMTDIGSGSVESRCDHG